MSYNVKIKNLVEYHEPKDASELREQSATKAPAEHLQCTHIVGGGIVGDSPDGADIERPNIPNYATEAYEKRIDSYRDQIKSGATTIIADQPNLAQRCLDGINEIELEPPHPKGDPMDIRRENTWFNYKLREKVALTVAVSVTHGTVAGAGTYNYGDPCTLVLTPDPHCHAVASPWSWSKVPADIVYNADYTTATFTVKSSYSVSIAAAVDQHTITASCTNGTITGAGPYEWGTPITLTVTPDATYSVLETSWTGLPATGVTFEDDFKKATFTVDSDRTISVACVQVSKLTFTVMNGTIDKTEFIGAPGSKVTVTAAPSSTDYEFTAWWDVTDPTAAVPVTGSTASYEFTVGTTDQTFEARNLAFITFTGPTTNAIIGITILGDTGWTDFCEITTETKVVGGTTYYGWYSQNDDWSYWTTSPSSSVSSGDIAWSYDEDAGEMYDDGTVVKSVETDSFDKLSLDYGTNVEYSNDKVEWNPWPTTTVYEVSDGVGTFRLVRNTSKDIEYEGALYWGFDELDGMLPVPTLTKASDLPAVDVQLYSYNSKAPDPEKIYPLFEIQSCTETPMTLSQPVTGGKIYVRAKASDGISGFLGNFTKVSGNAMSLVDYDSLSTASISESQFSYLFGNATMLTDASGLVLPSITLVNSCYDQMFSGCSSLTSIPSMPATITISEDAVGCCNQMFAGCAAIIDASSINITASSLPEGCFSDMFNGCTALTSIPTINISASTAEDMCCFGMFSGCTSLKDASSINIITTTSVSPGLNASSFKEMFSGCTSLEKAPSIKCSGTLGIYSYQNMFSDCIALNDVSGIKLTGLTSTNTSSFQAMFKGCTALGTAPVIESTGASINSSVFKDMFNGCTALTDASTINLKFTSLINNIGSSFYQMFKGCISLVTGPTIDVSASVSNNSSSYASMFEGCSALTDASITIDATTATQYCYQNMFKGCTSLKHAPSLTITSNSGQYACASMFEGCTALEDAPSIQLTNYSSLNQYCCQNMFKGCKSLASLPAGFVLKKTANYCYQSMFDGCEALTSLPDSFIFDNSTAISCYDHMFSGCKALATLPTGFTLPATTLKNYCYQYMFNGCSNLTTLIPALPATTLVTDCYKAMFNGCTKLTGDIDIACGVPYLSDGTTSACGNMFSGAGKGAGYGGTINVSGVTDAESTIKQAWHDHAYVDMPHTASGDWNVDVKPVYCLKFEGSATSDAAFNSLKVTKITGGEYSLNGYIWKTMTAGTSYSFTAGSTVWVRAKSSKTYGFQGKYTKVSGDISGLVDWSKDPSEVQIPVGAFAVNNRPAGSGTGTTKYGSLFAASYSTTQLNYNDTLTDASGLRLSNNFQSTTSGYYYSQLFYHCTKLTAPPVISSITTIPYFTFYGMFDGCTSLTTPPTFQTTSTVLGEYCCSNMFNGCTGITSLPSDYLPTTTYSSGNHGSCYEYMFAGCTNLTFENDVLNLPIVTLSQNIYLNMFYNCPNITGTINIAATSPYYTGTSKAFTNMTLCQSGSPKGGTVHVAGGDLDVWNNTAGSAGGNMFGSGWTAVTP